MLRFFTALSILVTLSLSSQGVIKNDFRVNNDTIGNDSYQPSCVLFYDSTGMIVWQDGRNGENNTYGVLLNNDGTPNPANFKVSTQSGSITEFNPFATTYGESVLVVFQYGYGQWLLKDGTSLGSTFSLNLSTSYQLSAAVTDSGIFVVGRVYTGGSYRLVFRRLDFDGSPISDTVIVNDDASSAYHYSPAIATYNGKNIVVVWHDNRSGGYDVYGQLFDPSGNKIGSNFIVNDDTTSTQDNSDVSMDSTGNFVVLWGDYRNANKDIYLQRYDANGSPIGSNVMVNDDGGVSYQDYPSVSMAQDGRYVVVWLDGRGGVYKIYGQRYDASGTAIGLNFPVTDNTAGSEYQYSPSVYFNGNLFLVSWEDQREDRSIFYRIFNWDGTPYTASDQMANDTTGTRKQQMPAVDSYINNTIVVWEDYRETYYYIYYSVFDNHGNALYDNIQGIMGFEPDVACISDTEAIIACRYGIHIYFEYVSPQAEFSDTVDAATSGWRYDPAVDANANEFIVVWYDSRGGDYDIYARAFNNDGTPVTTDFLVNDDASGASQYDPDVAISPSGRFLVVWQDYRDGLGYIYGQLYQNDGSPIGSNFLISDTTTSSTAYRYSPSIAYMPSGRFIVVWRDSRSPSGIYGQVVDTTGTLVDTNFAITSYGSYTPDVKVSPSGDIVVVMRNGDDIYGRRLRSDLSFATDTFKVNNDVEGPNPYQWYPSVGVNDSIFFVVWQDAKWQLGYDIAGKIFPIDYVGVEEHPDVSGFDIKGIIVSDVIDFEYVSDRATNIKISLYDISGREIALIKEGMIKAGKHHITYNTKDILPGVYFLNVKNGKSHIIKKVVVVR